MNKRPYIAPHFIMLLREYNEPYVYYDFGRPKREGREMGYYICKLSGLREFDPVKIFTANKMKRFHELKDMFKYLKRVEYNKWRSAEYDEDFVTRYFDMVKVMYYPRRDFDNIITKLNDNRKQIKDRYDKIVRDFCKEYDDALDEFKTFVDVWGAPLN